jgi:nucleotide-binding universal stress UspA family protein
MRATATNSNASFRRVLVATDFSPGAARALGRAARLPLAPGSQLLVLHVLPGLPREIARQGMRKAKAALKSAVGTASSLLQGRGVPADVKAMLAVGDASEEIVLAARSEGMEMIVLGRHSRRRASDVFLGSTAHRVVRAAGLPVLVVSGDPAVPYRRTLAAIDLEVMSRATLELLLRVLGPGTRTVDLVHAFEVPAEALAFPWLDVTKLSRWGDKFRRQAVARVEEFLRWLPDLGVRWRASVRPGSASAAVLAEAQRRKADLLAVGTHGKGGLSRLLLGSTAERVLAGSRCDILVARPSRIVRAAPPRPLASSRRTSGG